MSYCSLGFASQVFKCTDASGNVSFGYTPCPIEQVKASSAPTETIAQRLDKISSIDAEIAKVQRQFRDLRLDLEYKLKRAEDVDQQDHLREQYQKQTGELLDRISRLRSDRGELVNDAVKLLITRENNSWYRFAARHCTARPNTVYITILYI